MSNLYARTITLSIILTTVILGSFYFIFSYFLDLTRNVSNRVFIDGNMATIQRILKRTPLNAWDTVLKELSPINRPKAKIVTLDQLTLDRQQKRDLAQGKIILHTGPLQYFFNYGLPDIYALQKIGDTKKILQIQEAVTMYSTIEDDAKWLVTLIKSRLRSEDPKHWQKVINSFEATYHIPMKLISINSTAFQQLKRQNFVKNVGYTTPQSDGYVSTVFFTLGQTDKVLVLGPIEYPKFFIKSPAIQLYYLLGFALLTMLVVLFSTWIFSRNVRKIYKLTDAYSKGTFNKHIKFSHFSILSGIYNNIINMGNSIQSLMKTQQNMSRFVAHEIRTPLYTMQLALDAMEKSLEKQQNPTTHLNSIRQDINDLNKLVSYFLLYSRSTSNELTLKQQSLDIKQWLSELVNTHQAYEISLMFESRIANQFQLSFDPELLKIVMNNLISNALKFANNTINVSLEGSQNHVVIHIDDDGPGVEEDQQQAIFQAFVTLEGDSFGKHIGLGLVIAKSIVELHGGTVKLQTSPILSGARFSIHLPVSNTTRIFNADGNCVRP